MIIKEAKGKYEMQKVLKTLVPAVKGCDQCKKKLPTGKGGYQTSLEVSVFDTVAGETESKRLEFCSWKCVAKAVKKEKSNYFISLPYLHCDGQPKGMNFADFIRILK